MIPAETILHELLDWISTGDDRARHPHPVMMDWKLELSSSQDDPCDSETPDWYKDIASPELVMKQLVKDHVESDWIDTGDDDNCNAIPADAENVLETKIQLLLVAHRTADAYK